MRADRPCVYTPLSQKRRFRDRRRGSRRCPSNQYFVHTFGYAVTVTVVPLGEARNHLSEYVAQVERTHERITITRHGHAAAVLISADDLASIEETLDVLRTPGAVEAIMQGRADAAADRFVDADEIKALYTSR
jgi:antitoxin YefM